VAVKGRMHRRWFHAIHVHAGQGQEPREEKTSKTFAHWARARHPILAHQGIPIDVDFFDRVASGWAWPQPPVGSFWLRDNVRLHELGDARPTTPLSPGLMGGCRTDEGNVFRKGLCSRGLEPICAQSLVGIDYNRPEPSTRGMIICSRRIADFFSSVGWTVVEINTARLAWKLLFERPVWPTQLQSVDRQAGSNQLYAGPTFPGLVRRGAHVFSKISGQCEGHLEKLGLIDHDDGALRSYDQSACATIGRHAGSLLPVVGMTITPIVSWPIRSRASTRRWPPQGQPFRA